MVEHAVVVDRVVVDLTWRVRDHMRVAMLSNAGPELERRLRRFGLAQLFHPVMNSHRIGMAKPNPMVFRHASERLHLAPDQILFVDDQARNINAAAQLGFHTHRFVSTEQFASYAGSLLAPEHQVGVRED